jgi:tellurite resistance protein TehA-like permease
MVVRWFARLEPSPDVFAVVMATGVVSVAAFDHAYWRIAVGLSGLAAAAFVLLGLGFVLRAVSQPGRVVRLTRDPDVALRMFTFVAACTVLAGCWPSHPAVMCALGLLGLAGWFVLAPLAGIDVNSRPPPELRDQVHGAWLLPAVATQGLAITAAEVSEHFRLRPLLLFATTAWIIGIVIYLAVAWLLAWRVLAAPFVPDAVTPDSWIVMGALAIAALAGGHIARTARTLSASDPLGAWAGSGTWWCWVVASLWIPVLLYAEVWRTDQLAGSLRYQGVWWSAVFPIGMYSAASSTAAAVLNKPALKTISLVFCWIAITLWILVAVGFLHSAAARRARSGAKAGH